MLDLTVEPQESGYCSFAHSALASFRTRMSGAASFPDPTKSGLPDDNVNLQRTFSAHTVLPAKSHTAGKACIA